MLRLSPRWRTASLAISNSRIRFVSTTDVFENTVRIYPRIQATDKPILSTNPKILNGITPPASHKCAFFSTHYLLFMLSVGDFKMNTKKCDTDDA